MLDGAKIAITLPSTLLIMAGTTGVGIQLMVGAGTTGDTIDGAAIGIGAITILIGIRPTTVAFMAVGLTALGMATATIIRTDTAGAMAITVITENDTTPLAEELLLTAPQEEVVMLPITAETATLAGVAALFLAAKLLQNTQHTEGAA